MELDHTGCGKSTTAAVVRRPRRPVGGCRPPAQAARLGLSSAVPGVWSAAVVRRPGSRSAAVLAPGRRRGAFAVLAALEDGDLETAFGHRGQEGAGFDESGQPGGAGVGEAAVEGPA